MLKFIRISGNRDFTIVPFVQNFAVNSLIINMVPYHLVTATVNNRRGLKIVSKLSFFTNIPVKNVIFVTNWPKLDEFFL